ncbi:MAG TPA: glycosyltransferase family A protein [Myxococcota bacterium]|nr:glycosyltransferase family A protein [Myxococcota bacterium]
MKSRYVVVTPARDEEETLPHTIDSMRAQQIPPARWIIVDDGSTDGTLEIARRAEQELPWLEVMSRGDRGHRALGGGVVETFDEGLDRLDGLEWDYVVKLDADLSFEPDYFERLLRRFDDNPRLGMASGKTFLMDDGQKKIEWCHDEHVRGPAKMYRAECFEAIGGLVAVRGWDMIDETRAQMLGWETRSYIDIELIHHRPIDGRQSNVLSSRYRMGELYHFLGYHPLYHLARSLRSAVQDFPIVVGGIALLLGYVSAALRRRERYDEEYVRFVQRKQMRRFSLQHLTTYLRESSARDGA